jgi:hypothetical protein
MSGKLRERLFKAFHEKNALQRYVARRCLFDLFQRLGVHITGDHFYEIVPDTKLVARKYSQEPRDFAGIEWRFPESEQRAVSLVKRHAVEFLAASSRFGFREKNYYFRGIDALMLYCFLRDLKPGKMVEIGQGYSTRIALAALERNALETKTRPMLVSVDPYPRFSANELPSCLALEVIQEEAQNVQWEPLLENCAFLFVDSSHVYKFGSDVAFEFNNLYPRLPSGMVLHVHDIFSPYEYPREWIVQDKLFWNEQYLLECFLMYNSAFEVHLPVHLLVRKSKTLMEAIRSVALDERFEFSGSSFYLRRC